MTVQGGLFLGLAVLLCAFVVLGILRLGYARLESSAGIWRDGLAYGKAAPAWMLSDSAGNERRTPSYDRWQLLIFTDHSLRSFPDLIPGMHQLEQEVREVEALVLARGTKEECNALVRDLDLQIPVIPVDQAFYNRYRVRVMPFATLLDPGGITRWVGLVNSGAQLFHAWQTLWTIDQATTHGKNGGT